MIILFLNKTQETNLSLLPPLDKLKIPVIGSPLFIISNPDLVIAQCKAGVIGSFPCLNAREGEGEPNMLEIWLKKINDELDRHNQKNPDNPAAPYAVNHIVHKSNIRLEKDIDICAKWKAPVWITSLGARPEVNKVAHEANGIVLHDIINNFFAKKAILISYTFSTNKVLHELFVLYAIRFKREAPCFCFILSNSRDE